MISSFGFCELWRRQCVGNLPIHRGAVVADLMAGSGECWSSLSRRIEPKGRILSVDFSSVMCSRQRQRLQGVVASDIKIHCENALQLSFPNGSVDFVVSAFGLKTFNGPQLDRFALEIFRILRAGGSCSLLEISLPELALLRIPYRFYVNFIIPMIGRIFLKNIECYKMLGVYTEAFGSCSRVAGHFRDTGFKVDIKDHFFGCATSIVATKTGK